MTPDPSPTDLDEAIKQAMAHPEETLATLDRATLREVGIALGHMALERDPGSSEVSADLDRLYLERQLEWEASPAKQLLDAAKEALTTVLDVEGAQEALDLIPEELCD